MAQFNDRKPHLLVIEDNPGDVELLRLALEHAELDCDLKVIDDGGEALAYVQQESETDLLAPDLAIVDLNLPKYDGVEILEAMRASAKFLKVPVAVFSSSSLPRERANIEKLNIVHQLRKPSDLEEFMQIGTLVKQLLAGGLESGASPR